MVMIRVIVNLAHCTERQDVKYTNINACTILRLLKSAWTAVQYLLYLLRL